MAASARPLSAHDIPQRFFDRALDVTIESQQIRVTYHLSLSALTMAEELLSLVGAGGISGMASAERMDLYAERLGPLLAHGLLVRVDAAPLDLVFRGATHVMEEHPRFQFEFGAVTSDFDRGTHRIQLEDTSFFLEKGQIRIALRASPPYALQSSSVPAQLDEVVTKSAWEMTPEQQDAARRVEATWISPAGVAEEGAADEPRSALPIDSASPVLPAPTALGGEAVAQSGQDLTDLLDRWSLKFSTILLGLAFFFGAAHAMTPGHGKTMVAAYLVGERGTLRHAVCLGLTTALTHTSSVLAVALLLRLAGRELTDKVNIGFALVSGILVAVLGGCLLVTRLRSQLTFSAGRKSRPTADPAGSVCGSSASRELAASGPAWPGLIALGISGGIVPCPDAIVLLLIATAKGQIESAVYLLLSFSAGLAGALVLVGILAVNLRGFLASRLGSGHIVRALPVVSAAAIFAVGIYLCTTTLREPANPTSHPTTPTRTAGP